VSPTRRRRWPAHEGLTVPVRQIKQIALSRPVDHDLPFSTWSLAKLAEFLVAEGVVDDISHEGLPRPTAGRGRQLSSP
jgi:hypothetical protein